MDKNMRAGFQGKKDAMRELADKLMNHPGTAKDVYPSASSADKEQMRLYKKGGHVKNSTKSGDSCKKFAAGGVAKIRRKQCTKSGSPLPASKQKRGCKNK